MDANDTTSRSLFNSGEFDLHSGAKSSWKIDCDALSDGDIGSLARMIVERVPAFGDVEGIPRGGLRLAAALKWQDIATAPKEG